MKKILLQKSWVIKAPRQKVYAIMSDFENMPMPFEMKRMAYGGFQVEVEG